MPEAKQENVVYTIDAEQLTMESSKLIDDLGQYFRKFGDVETDGKRLKITVPKGTSKRDIRLRITKFLHQANTATEFRPIAVALSPNEYKIFRKKED